MKEILVGTLLGVLIASIVFLSVIFGILLWELIKTIRETRTIIEELHRELKPILKHARETVESFLRGFAYYPRHSLKSSIIPILLTILGFILKNLFKKKGG